MIGTTGMDLEVFQARSDLYFQFRGRIVLEECERVKKLCLPLINKGVEQVVVDLSRVEFIDSAGLGVLVGFKMTASKNKARIVLLSPSRSVADILYISKLDGIFDIVTGTEADVLKAQIAQPQYRVTPGSGPGGASGIAASGMASGMGPAMSGGMPGMGHGAPPSAPVPPSPFAQERQPFIPERPAEKKPSYGGNEWAPNRAESGFPADLTGISGDDVSKGAASSSARSEKEILEEHCRRAVDYMRQGNYEMSVEEYKSALKLNPDYLPALNNLAIVYEKQPSWIPRAIEMWEHVLRLSQGHGDQKHVDRAQRHLSNLRKMSA